MKVVILIFSVFLLMGCQKSGETASSTPAPPSDPPSSDQGDKPSEDPQVKFEKFGLIREFGGTDTAALFGILPESGKFEISKIYTPSFIKAYRTGTLTQSVMDKLFLSSAQPLGMAEKQKLLKDFSGAQVIYLEGYEGQLCTSEEIKYEIVTIGKMNDINVEITFQFVAEPNTRGNCTFQIFGTQVKYVK